MEKKYNFTIPSVNIPELLILDELLSDNNFSLRLSICHTILTIVLISQISVNINIDPRQKQSLESVRKYKQLFFGKNRLFIGLSAAVSIRKTMAAYAALDAKEIKADFDDLMNNTTGPATRASRLQMILNDPSKLRSHRRNIMLRTTGKIQSQPIYQPTLPYPDITNLNTEFLSNTTTFELNEFLDVKQNIIDLLYPSGFDLNHVIEWADGIKIPNGKGKNLTALEFELFGDNMSRLNAPTLPETPSATKIKNTPWKKAVVSQIENLKE